MVVSTKARKRVKAPLPCDVRVAWLTLPTTADMAASVSLNDTEYAFSCHLLDGEVVGYRFSRPDPKSGEEIRHDINASDECDCWDYSAGLHPVTGERTGRVCKHVHGLHKLLAGLDAAVEAADQAERAFDWPSDAEIDEMYRESCEDEALASGRWCEADDVPQNCVGA